MMMRALGDPAIRLAVALVPGDIPLHAPAGAREPRLRPLGRRWRRLRLRLVAARFTIMVTLLAVFDNAMEAVAVAEARSVCFVLVVASGALAWAWPVVVFLPLCPFDLDGFDGFGGSAGLSKHCGEKKA